METITVKKQDLEEAIRDIVCQSHQALATVQSNSNADIKTTLAVMMEKQDVTNCHLVELNGKAARNADNISQLQVVNSWMKGIGIAVVTLSGLTFGAFAYAYTVDKETLKDNNKNVAMKADAVANDLKDYQGKQQQIIDLLNKMNKK